MENVSMDEKRTKLKKFFEKYGYNFLEDGTKEKIIRNIEAGNDKLILEILEVIDQDWIARTKEVGRFFVFTDCCVEDSKGNILRKPYMKASYMDNNSSKTQKIPTIRRVVPRYRSPYDFDDFDYR